MTTDYHALPLVFELNKGQADSQSQFLARGRGYGIHLTSNEAVLILNKEKPVDTASVEEGDNGVSEGYSTSPDGEPSPGETVRDVLRVQLVGGRSDIELEGLQQLVGRSNYFFDGSDPVQLTDIPQYAQVIARDMYAGVDVLYQGDQHSLRYDLIVHAGADLSQVSVRFDGAQSVTVNDEGQLVLSTSSGDVIQRAPVMYQEVNGQKQSVAGRYVARADGTVGFAVEGVDAGQSLVIDPTIDYSGYLGGSGSEIARAVAVDLQGNIYVVGRTTSNDFPTSGPYQGSNAGAYDIFVTKLNAAGDTVLYSTYMGGDDDDMSSGLWVDAAGCVYVSGYTESSVFPTTAGAFQTARSGTRDVFVVKFSEAGNSLVYSTLIGGTNEDLGGGIAVDAEGFAYINGYSNSTNYDVVNAYQGTKAGDFDVIVTKLNTTGTGLVWSTYLGGTAEDKAGGIAVDLQGRVYVAGFTLSSDFDTSGGAYDATLSGTRDAFVTRFNADGTLDYSTYLGGSGSVEQVSGIAVDDLGQAHVAGFSDAGFPTTAGAYDTTGNGARDTFVTKFSADGSSLVWSTGFGGSGDEYFYDTIEAGGKGIALDSAGNVYVIGMTESASFPLVDATQATHGGGTTDAFVARVDFTGGSLGLSTYLGGSDEDDARGIALDADDNVYVVGHTQSTDFPTVSPLQGSFGGGTEDVFLVRYGYTAAVYLTAVNDDTGVSADDFVTNDDRLTLEGTSIPSADVNIFRADIGYVDTVTADGSGDWSYDYTAVDLDEGVYAFTFSTTIGGYTTLESRPYLVTVDQTAPDVTLIVDATTTDLTPLLVVVANDDSGIPVDGTVTLDVDLNNNGSFAGGELGYATGTMTDGLAFVTVGTALSLSTVQVRARVSDVAGNEGTSNVETMIVQTSGSAWTTTDVTALVDALEGDGLLQRGNLRFVHELDLDNSPGTDVGLNPALVYNSERVNVKPIIRATVQTDNASALPSTITAHLTFNGVTQSAQSFSTTGRTQGELLTIAQQAGTAVSTTGYYQYTMTVTMDYGSPITQTVSGGVYVVARPSNPYGSGWTLRGVDRLVTVTGGILREYGGGGHGFYSSLGGGAYDSPAGDNGTLSSATAGGVTTYTYSTPDGATRTFDQAGYQANWTSADTKAVVSYTYQTSSSGKLINKIETPDGAITTITYTSNRVNKFTTGSRVTTMTYTSTDLTRITNPDGGARNLTYDGSHRLTRSDFAQLKATFAYDTYGLLSGYREGDLAPNVVTPLALFGLASLAEGTLRSSVMDGLNRTTFYELDSSGRLRRQITPDGGFTDYDRDAEGRVIGITDPVGRATYIERDAAGYVTTVTYADGATTRSQYQSAFHAMTTYTDERGGVWTYTYDAGGHRLTEMNPLASLTEMKYNATSGLLEEVKDALGRVTTYLYDGSRRLETTINAALDRTTLTYDANGNVATSKDQLGRVTSFTNDALGRVKTVVYPTGLTGTYAYDAAGQLTTMVQAATGTTVYDWTRAGQSIKVTEGLGTAAMRTTLPSYNSVGQMSAIRDVRTQSTQIRNDAVGRPIGTTDALGNPDAVKYDLAGQVTRTTDKLGRFTFYEYDNRGRLTQTRDALGFVTTTVYDDAGNVVGTINALGIRTSYAYDALNRLTTMTEAVGVSGVERTTTTVYDPVGNVVQRIDALGRVTSYAYDSLNRVTTVTEAVGTGSDQRTMTYAYDKVGNQTGVTDWRGYRTSREFDALNRLTTLTEAVGEGTDERVTTYAFDSAGRLSGTTDAMGFRTTFAYDALGRQISRTEGLGGSQTRTVGSLLDPADAEIGSVDGKGKVWQNTRDQLGRNNYSINPLGQSSRTLHNAASEIKGFQDERLNVTNQQMDTVGRTKKVMDALGNAVSYAYDGLGRTIESYNARNYRTTFAYDALDRLVSSTDAEGNVTATEYDLNGNVSVTYDALGKRTTYTYDSLNRVKSVQNPGGGIYTTVYDDAGNVTEEINALGKITTHVYDALNRKTETHDAIGGVTYFAYDDLGRMIELTDPEGNSSEWEYNSLGFLVEETDPLGDITTHAYDANGRVTLTVDREDRKREFQYDAAGRLELEVWKNDSNVTVNLLTFSYDKAGNQLTASDYHGTYTLTYDALNRVDTVQGLFGVDFDFGYDEVGNRILVQDSLGGTSASAYDGVNRLIHRDLDDGVTTLSYDLEYSARNQMTTITRYSDLDGANRVGYSQYEYDNAGRREKLKHRDDSNTLLANYTYTYDLHSRVTAEILNGTTTAYGYDFTDQLTSAGTYSYDYDLNGNRDSAGYVTDPGNRMVNDGTFTYTYDETGNLVGKSMGALAETWNYEYDNRNQLIGVEKRDAVGGTLLTQATYVYDVWGNRVEAQVWENGIGSSTERYVVDGWKRTVDGWNNSYPLVGLENFDVPLTLDGTNALVMRRLFGDGVDQVIARIDDSGDAGWYLQDYQGSIQNIVDEAGTLINTIAYDGIGNVTFESNPSDPDDRKYIARPYNAEADSTDVRARQVRDGHMWGEDPKYPQSGLNPYMYVSNKPTNATDPSGLVLIAYGETTAIDYRDYLAGLNNDIASQDGLFPYPVSVSFQKISDNRYVFTFKGADKEKIAKAAEKAYDDGKIWDAECLWSLISRTKHKEVYWKKAGGKGRYNSGQYDLKKEPTSIRDLDLLSWATWVSSSSQEDLLFIGQLTRSVAVRGSLPSIGLNLAVEAGLAGPAGGFRAGGGGVQALYNPLHEEFSVYGYVSAPTMAFGYTNDPKYGNGFGPFASVNVGAVLAFNVNNPSDYLGPFTGVGGTVIGPSGIGGYASIAGDPAKGSKAPWAISGGMSFGSPGVSIAIPDYQYYYPLYGNFNRPSNEFLEY